MYHPLAFQAILKELAFIKSLYNIDDNRVYLTGHSNGGEGAFYFAINQPTSFASFLAFTYFPQAYITNTPLRNLTNNRSFYGVSAKNDHLFKLSKVDSIYQYAKTIGANWKNYTLDGDHGLPITEGDRVSFIYDTLFAKIRNPFPKKIRWETDNVNNGRYDWISITRLDTMAHQANWVRAYNPGVMTKDGRTKLDFNPHRTGIIEASVSGNTVTIKASRVKEFSFFVYPQLVDINKPLIFIINGLASKPMPIKKDKVELIQAFEQTKDRILLPVAKLTMSVTH